MKILTNKIKKTLAIITITVVLSTQNIIMVAYAEDSTGSTTETVQSTTPEVTNTPSQPEQTETQKTSDTSNQSVQTTEATSPATTQSSTSNNVDSNTNKYKQDPDYIRFIEKQEQKERERQEASAAKQQKQATTDSTTANNVSSGSQNQSNNPDGTTLSTGNATNTGTVLSNANTNFSGASEQAGNSAAVINSDNGANSTNNGSANIINDKNTNQNNTATVDTNLNLGSTTGNNRANDNRGDTSITTGNASTTGTVITAVNTNVDGIAMSEFNINDNHTGDIILDFGAACTSGCNPMGAIVQNSGNGDGSDNLSETDITNNSSIFQYNDATVGNNLILSADTGNNNASDNRGDTTITTGDANIAANLLTFVNNNIAGNVLFGVVNIFGNLIGDIILPESVTIPSGSGSTIAANANNGEGSSNLSTIDLENNDAVFQSNSADINNDIIIEATTGNNSTRDNRGDSSITTGDTNVDVNVLNIANSNISSDETWWLVIVNEAGNWVGKILGAPEGSNMAGSTGTEFSVDENGDVVARNNDNDNNSTNTSSISKTNNNTTEQINNASINNSLNLSANTGGNRANDNRGDTSITTGDANVVVNLVNFVNNNIVGNGKLVVTFVNVFGSWVGDFVTPGHEKETKNDLNENNNTAIGGHSSQNNENKKSSKSQTEDKNTENNEVLASSNINHETLTHNNTPFVNSSKSVVGSILTGVSDAQTKVAGIVNGTNDLNDIVADSDSLKINLAWLLVILPILLFATKLTKRIVRRSANV